MGTRLTAVVATGGASAAGWGKLSAMLDQYKGVYTSETKLGSPWDTKYPDAVEALDKWVNWAGRSRIPAFVKLEKSVVKHRASILASIEHGLSNGRIESMNTKIRLITRVAFGFKKPEAPIALAMHNLGGHKPELPGRK